MGALVLGLSVAAVTFTATVPAASARSWAGSVNMDNACAKQYGWYEKSGHSSNSAYSWYCWNSLHPSWRQQPVDVGYYCRVVYGSNAYADPQGGGAYDWGCYYS